MADEPWAAPASPGQHSLWLRTRLAPEDSAYHVTAVFRLTGELDVAALTGALHAVVDRHESLRTVFALRGETLTQLVLPRITVDVPVRDVPRKAVPDAVEELLHRPFDLAEGPLIRLHLLRVAPREHLAVLAVHHIVTDAASSAVLLEELTLGYAARVAGADAELEEPPLQYADFAVWQRDRLSGAHLEELTSYWARRLAGAAPLPPTPRADRAGDGEARGRVHHFTVPAGTVRALEKLAHDRGATAFMALLAGYQAVLSRWFRQDDITVVSPTEGRGRPELENVVGYFVNPLLLRTDLSGVPGFPRLLDRVRANCLEDFDRQEMPFERAVEELRRHGRPGAEQLASGAMLVLQSPRPSTWRVAGLTMELLPSPVTTAKAGLVLDVRPAAGGYEAVLEYDTALLDEAAAERFARALTGLFDRVADRPGQPLPELLRDVLPDDALPELPAPGTAGPERKGRAPFVAPRTPVEREVARIWAELLDADRVGVHDHFFDLGGQSLAAVRLAARLRDAFPVEISVRDDLYRDFTVAAVAGTVFRRLAGPDAPEDTGGAPSGERIRLEEALLGRAAPGPATPLARLDAEARFPASVAQEGMWASLSPERPAPLLTAGVRVRGPLDADRLRAAWDALAARHDTLRSTYRMEDGTLTQVVAPSVRLPLETADADPEGFARLVRDEVDRPFDLSEDAPARMTLLRFGPDDHAVLVVLHHMVGDGRTLEILARDLWALYVEDGTPLPPLTTRFADFAQRHRALVTGPRGAELAAYWTERLAGAEPVVLPDDLTPADTLRPPGRAVDIPMPRPVFTALSRLAAERRTTLNSVGLAAFDIVLARRSGQRDLCLRAPVSYRDDTDVQDLVADFSNDVVIRADLSGEPSYGEVLRRVEAAAREGFARHELPPHLLEPRLPDPELLGRLFRVQFTTETEVRAGLVADGLRVEPMTPPFPYAYRPLSVRLRHGGEQPHTVWICRADQFSPGRVEELAAEFHEVITAMAADPSAPAFG
ncbi:condensation domain-containing protein [Streptomyces sp. enrichment culture]|uniref:condensation domain-containing protein n=1 Tax=Streptomyces sp. enrichment culture TaxID=1795815 RepID=UPI003F553F4D